MFELLVPKAGVSGGIAHEKRLPSIRLLYLFLRDSLELALYPRLASAVLLPQHPFF